LTEAPIRPGAPVPASLTDGGRRGTGPNAGAAAGIKSTGCATVRSRKVSRLPPARPSPN